MKADVVIIGAGAVGAAISRELSRYQIDIVVVDKNDDIGGEASRANSAIIHTGYDASPGSLESELVVAANPLYRKLTQDLDIPFAEAGAILPAMTEEEESSLAAIMHKAMQNRVYDVTFLSRERILDLEPEISPDVRAGLYIPREGIIDPFTLVIALAENAYVNGVRFLTQAKVTAISRQKSGSIQSVTTDQGVIDTTWVVNAGGLHCDEIAQLVGITDFTVNPRKGQFFIMDKNAACSVSKIVLPVPNKLTKGKLASPTIHGNMLIGPTAEDLLDKKDKSTTREGLAEVVAGVRKLIPRVNPQDCITQYAGLRPNRNPEGLHIDVYPELRGYVGLSGVRSTGITASVAIAKYVAELMLENGLPADRKPHWQAERSGIKRFCTLPRHEQETLIAADPRYQTIICRCETVTEAEIVDAIRRPLGARSVDGLKRRIRTGAGRCQGGFCGPRVIEILARELGIPAQKVVKDSPASWLVYQRPGTEVIEGDS
jgi:glycerol-3-phosphate dehydrogenase